MLTDMTKKKKWGKMEGLVSIKGYAPQYTALQPHPIDDEK